MKCGAVGSAPDLMIMFPAEVMIVRLINALNNKGIY